MGLNFPEESTIAYTHFYNDRDLKSNGRIQRLGALFNILGTDPDKNIHVIVSQACEILNGQYALYRRIDKENNSLTCLAGHNLPPDFPHRSLGRGHICYEVTIKKTKEPVVINDISKTPFQLSDPIVKQYNFKSYIGAPITCNQRIIGSLAVVGTQVRHFDQIDIYLISTLANALTLEEERLQMNRVLQQRETKFQNLYQMIRKMTDNVPDLIWAKDLEDRYLFANQAMCDKLLKCEFPEDVIGKTDIFFAQQERKAGYRHTFGEICLNSDKIVKKSKISKRFLEDGLIRNRYLMLDVHKAPFWGSDGQIIGTVGCGHDVTKEKQMENEARKTETERNRLSAKLQQTQKMEAIAILAGGIAHQFNNALAVILGNLELIHLDGMYDAKLKIYAEPINQAAQKMVQLTGQLMAYACGRKFQTQSIPASRYVQDTLKIIQHSMAPYVDVQTDLAPDTDHIEIDLTQMQMLLTELLINASESMEKEGQIRITLKNICFAERQKQHQHPGLKPGRYIWLQIVDNGKGMDSQTRDRIFEPFFTTKFQGRGLGMAAVYSIVKKHGGYVYVDSVLGEGSTVSIYLPGKKISKSTAVLQEPHHLEHKGTALIVEDEYLVMEVNRAIIKKLGYRVLEAKTGKEAIAITRNYDGPIDFVLLDVILPDMDGSLIYPKLMAARPNLKVIACSGFPLDDPAADMLEAGAESYIQKPFTAAALSAILKKILKIKPN